ncbi:3-oxoacyl-[acyl-carrier protein] reductase [Chitinophaga sp. CF118]|uniref:SDR family oxidoreductase n=1 Tax=Chitinophaga sp. CF118 TaxID=1884367 RepID=UPI0008EA7BFD|nr:SDR family oxidoreductase [Chitinophaga sp. CF118]SFD97717.1 3-oxoacyl-[acyl-carrier protein] reductase [Chitinophaga sp. CF118]
MNNLKEKVILITGASKGIGAHMAKAFAARGAKVVINYANSHTKAEELLYDIRQKGETAIIVKADVSKEDEVNRLFKTTIKEFGRIDVLINNAGMMKTKLLKENTEADFNEHFNINVKGIFFTMKEAATKLADNGIIINISSTVTRVMFPGYSIYSATKAAVDQMTRVFAKEIGRGISVNAIAPGPTNTELFLNGKSEELLTHIASLNAFGRVADPEDITKIVLFMASDDSKWISGQIIAANGAMA